MFCLKRTLALALTCALLLAAAPGATATTFSNMTGTFSGSNAYYAMTITLNQDGSYSTAIEQGGQTYRYAGYYSTDAYYIYFWPSGGTQSALGYWFTGDMLTLTDWNTGETMVLTRQQALPTIAPYTPVIPSGLAGTWTGNDRDGVLFITLEEDGEITVAHNTPDAIEQTGSFIAENGLLEANFADGSYISFQFLLTGNTLILAGGEDGEPITLTRMQGSFIPPSPLPTFAVETLVPLEPTYAPETTPAPMPTEAPPATFAPAITEAPAATEIPGDTSAPVVQGPVGIWQGTDALGSKKLVLAPDGRIEIAYDQEAAPRRVGVYTLDSSTIKAVFDDGTAEDFRYILMGDTLLLTDAQLGNPVTMTRWIPTLQPAVTIAPALIGTWGGTDGEYIEMTLKETGELDLFMPSDPSHCVTYPYKVLGGKISVQVDDQLEELAYAIQGDVLTITYSNEPIAYSRKAGPLVRQQMPEQAVSAMADAAIVGVWGGLDGSVYGEITLFGDGTYVKFVPEDESLSRKGTYMANGGNLAVLLPDGALQGTYALDGDGLTITWQNAEPLTFLKQTGSLARLAQTGE